MKKLILIALLIPSLSFAQKIEVAEMGGYSVSRSTPFFENDGSYSNQLSVSYYFTKHISAGAYHEMNAWNPSTNNLGLLADFHLKHFYFGVSAGELFFNSKKIQDYYVYSNSSSLTYEPHFNYVKINPAIALGAHMGMTQKLCKHFSVREQVGYSYARSSGDYGIRDLSVKVKCASALVGIAYHL